MNLLLAKPNRYNHLDLNSDYNYVFVEATGTLAAADYIASHCSAEWKAKAVSEPIYHAICRDNYRPDYYSECGQHLLASEITIVKGTVKTLSLQLVAPTVALGLGMEELGKVFTCIPLQAYYSDHVYVVMEDTTVQLIAKSNALEQPNEKYVAPKPIVASINCAHLGFAGNTAIYVRVLNLGVYTQILAGIGNYNRMSTSLFTFPQTEQEVEKFSRLVYEPKKLTYDNTFSAIVGSIGGGDVVDCLLRLGKDPVHRHNKLMFQPNQPDYLKIDTDPSKVSFVDSNRVARLLEEGKDPWTATSRQTISWGKYLLRVFITGYLGNATVEQHSSKFTAAAADLLLPDEARPELLVVRGKDVVKYYNGKMYHQQDAGDLGNSCMRYAKCAKYLNLYAENPEQVRLLISRDRDNGLIHGRALVWTDGEQTYLDRIYTLTEKEKARMKLFGEKQGWEYLWDAGRDTFPKNVKIQLASPYHKHYPYMDSMAYLNVETGIISNNRDNRNTDALMREQYGNREVMNGETQCVISGKWAPKAKMVETVSKKNVFPEHAKELVYGGYELAKLCVVDELQGGGNIYKEHAVLVVIPPTGRAKKVKAATTAQSNPDFCFVAGKSQFYPKAFTTWSAFDKAFILLSESQQMSDGTYCLATSAPRYQQYLNKQLPNQSRRVQREAVEAPAPARTSNVVFDVPATQALPKYGSRRADETFADYLRRLKLEAHDVLAHVSYALPY